MRCCGQYAHRPECEHAPAYLPAALKRGASLSVGDRVWFHGERQGYTVKARDDRYLICTKPFNARRTVLYSIIDLKRGIRGADNLVFSTGYETDAQVKENMERLAARGVEVSHRNHVQLRITKVGRGDSE